MSASTKKIPHHFSNLLFSHTINKLGISEPFTAYQGRSVLITGGVGFNDCTLARRILRLAEAVSRHAVSARSECIGDLKGYAE